MNDKALTLLGFAAKAGALAFGLSNAIAAIKRRQAKIIVYSGDISQKSLKEILFYCKNGGISLFELKGTDMQGLSNAIGRKCGVAAVLSENFSIPLTEYLTSDI